MHTQPVLTSWLVKTMARRRSLNPHTSLAFVPSARPASSPANRSWSSRIS